MRWTTPATFATFIVRLVTCSAIDSGSWIGASLALSGRFAKWIEDSPELARSYSDRVKPYV
ncbi:MAG: hypothetical protein E4H03_13170 [Myxococcales bacterium]|nr:MAG: hypothetical protein E4H03_13170 [Myxococcales bacterium]